MTNESGDLRQDGPTVLAETPAATTTFDWRRLADQRLDRLVELEHDYALMRDRLSLLQVDYRLMLVASEEQLRSILERDRARLRLEQRLVALEGECTRAREAFAATHALMLNSRSWRLTRPLRVFSRWWVEDQRSLGGAARVILRVPLFRRVARFGMRRMPGLHARLRARLYPQPPTRNGSGDRH